MAYEQLRLDRQLCFRLYSATRLVVAAYRPYLEPLGITYPQYLVLMILWQEDGQLVGDIARRLDLETNTVTPLVQRMEQAGLVVRSRGVADTRQRLVTLTPRGRQMEEEAKAIPVCLAERLAASGVDIESMRGLTAPLDSLIDALHAASASGEKKTAQR